jgi:hypothetical protein
LTDVCCYVGNEGFGVNIEENRSLEQSFVRRQPPFSVLVPCVCRILRERDTVRSPKRKW